MLLFAVLAAVCLAAAFFSETHLTADAFEFTVALVPFQRGETVIAFPPLGKLRAATHWGPFQLKISLNAVDLEMLRSSFQEIPDLSTFLLGQLREQLTYFFVRLAIISFLCGAALLLLIETRSGNPARVKIREAIKGGFLTVLLLAMLLGITMFYPYRINAFATPHLEGTLAEAPWIIELSEYLLGTVDRLSEQLGLIAVNLEELSGRMERLQLGPETGEIRVLHISDIHNNPAAMDLIEKIAASFQVDLVIDTGDLTDYGSTLETELAARLTGLPCPYLFLPGNHDTPQSTELLRREGAIIIGSKPVEIAGLRISGLPDPASFKTMARVEEEALLLEEACRAVELLPGEGEKPDIFAIHNPLMAGPFMGKVPLILSGHTHRASLSFDDASGTITINAGTSGAAGVRGLLAPRENPYSMVLLYFNPVTGARPRLTCAELITIDHFPDSFSLQRYYNRPPEQPPLETISPTKEDPEE